MKAKKKGKAFTGIDERAGVEGEGKKVCTRGGAERGGHRSVSSAPGGEMIGGRE